MIVGKAIYHLLTNATDVTDIVSTRIYPEIAQQDADLPYIVYNVANNEPTDTKPEPSKLDTAQVEVNIYAESYTDCIDLAVAVRAALDRVKGTYNGVNVQSIQYQNEIIDFDEPQRAYNISADYDVRISRSGFEIAQGSPITGVQLGELSDVDVTGVTNGQLIAYNESTGNWEAANAAGGANELSDLSDASVSLPSDGEVLIYSGGEFVNDNIAISNVTGLQAALDAAPDNLRELTDVTISGLADNDYLQYDSASGTWQNSSLILGRNGEQYTGNYDSEAETLLDGATAAVELYYTAQADGDGLHEDAQTDTAQSGYDIRRKLYYAEKAQADPDTSGDWTQFADIADDTTFASAKATLLAYLKARTGGTVPISLKMTWEEVAEATLLLDTYTGAAAAYSLRQLRTGETEAVRVRRSSDNAEQTIGFSNGELDTTALATFCGSSDGFVKTWMDQSSNGNDATQTTAANQPKIYDGTTGVVTYNSKPCVEFNGSSQYLDGASHSGTAFSMLWTGKQDGTSNSNRPFGLFADDGTTQKVGFSFDSDYSLRYDGAASTGSLTPTTSAQILRFATRLNNAQTDHVNTTANINTTTALVSITASSISIGNAGIARNTHFDGFTHEAIMWDSDQSSNRTNIENDINTFYSIY